jgi:hypothetical protein
MATTTGVCAHCVSSLAHGKILNRETAGLVSSMGVGGCASCGEHRALFPIPSTLNLSDFKPRKRGPNG